MEYPDMDRLIGDGIYQKKGFKTIPHEFCGPGMRKIIHT